ncbi:MAG: prefoldin subunit alpha [Nitrososphaera sp.]|uniref:prefoldin subunit alpha n=1 Tax=Nitrososphaera sp. TaxID=1971748 RepID=UPI003D701801
MHTDSSGHSHDHPHDHNHPHDHSHAAPSSDQQRMMEQQLNEMAQQSRMLEAYINDVTNRQAAIGRMLEEARIASATIQGINSDVDVETLMPVGIGVYVKTMVPPVKKVIVNLGSGVAMEKSREDALNFVEARIKEYDVAVRQLEAQRQEIAMRMEQMQGQINSMLRSSQQG